MLKRVGVTGTVLAVAVLAGGSVAPATGLGGGEDDDRPITVRVLGTTVDEAFVDVGAPDFSLGDSFVFNADLTKDGKSVGHAGVVCTVTSLEREESQCVGTVWLRGGQIAVQGLVAGEPEFFKVPVTGGTGAFEGADGTLLVRQLSDTEEVLTFRLDD